MPGVGQCQFRLLHQSEVHRHGSRCGQRAGKNDGFGSVGSQIQRRRIGDLALEYDNAVLHHVVFHGQKILGVGEVQNVPEEELAFFEITGGDPQGTDDVFELLQAGGGGAVGVDQAVHAEVSVLGELAEVAAVVVFRLTLVGLAHINGVVAPFPDKAANEVVVLLDELLVVLGVSGAVAHGVDVFAEDEGLLFFVVQKISAVLRIGVHPADEVQVGIFPGLVVAGALVVGQPGGVVGFGPVEGVFKADAVARLVAHGPHHHRGMVFIPDDRTLDPVQNRFLPIGIPGQKLIFLLIAVGAN